MTTTPEPKSDAKQKTLVASLRGSLSAMKLTVDDYLCEKYADTEAENKTHPASATE